MFAVLKVGNTQYKVKENDEVKIHKLDASIGEKVFFDQVLMIGTDKKTCVIGTPYVKGVSVEAEILEFSRDKKVLIFKKRRRKNYRRLNGHRQDVTHIRINKITKI